FGVPIDETRAIFEEALDIIFAAWEPEEHSYHGTYFQIPDVRIWPVPIRRPDQILLHAVNSADSIGRSIARRLPALMARPITPFKDQVAEFASYRADLEGAGLDPEPFLDRATVLKYVFVAPTRAEAHELPREAFEWDLSILQELTTPTTTEMPKGYEFYEERK